MSERETAQRLVLELRRANTSAAREQAWTRWGGAFLGDDLSAELLEHSAVWDERLITKAITEGGWAYGPLLARDTRMTPSLAQKLLDLSVKTFGVDLELLEQGKLQPRQLKWREVYRSMCILARQGLPRDTRSARAGLIALFPRLQEEWDYWTCDFIPSLELFDSDAGAWRADIEPPFEDVLDLDPQSLSSLGQIAAACPSYSRDIEIVAGLSSTRAINVVTVNPSECRLRYGWRDTSEASAFWIEADSMEGSYKSNTLDLDLLVCLVKAVLRRTEL